MLLPFSSQLCPNRSTLRLTRHHACAPSNSLKLYTDRVAILKKTAHERLSCAHDTRTARHLSTKGGVASTQAALCTVRDHNMFGGVYLRGKRIYKYAASIPGGTHLTSQGQHHVKNDRNGLQNLSSLVGRLGPVATLEAKKE